MKKLRIVLLTVAVILIAAGAAFATNAAKSSQSTETGYYVDSSTRKCEPSPQMCTEVQGEICTWSGHNLYRREGTECTIPLYFPE
jgi:hypothetical protein